MSLKFNPLVPPFDMTGGAGSEGKEGKPGPEIVFTAHNSVAAQLGEGGGATKVKLNVADVDTTTAFDTVNNRFKPTTAGYYLVGAQAGGWQSALEEDSLVKLLVLKNGALMEPEPLGESGYHAAYEANNTNFEPGVVALVHLNGTTDYLELWGASTKPNGAQATAKCFVVFYGYLITTGQKGEKGTTGEKGETGEKGVATAKKPLAITGTEIEVEGTTENKIPESKLSTPEMVKLTGSQTITGTKEFVPASGTIGINVMAGIGTTTAAPGVKVETFLVEATNQSLEAVSIKSTVTLSKEGAVYTGLNTLGKVTYQALPGLNPSLRLFRCGFEVIGTEGVKMGTFSVLQNEIVVNNPSAAVKGEGANVVGLIHGPTYKKAGAAKAKGESTGLRAAPIIEGNWAEMIHRAVLMKDYTGTGTATYSAGLDVEDLKKATSNYSVRSTGTEVKLLHEGPIEAGGDVSLTALGKKIKVKEGANASMGVATLEGGKAVVATTAVTANSRIFLTINEGGLLNVGVPYEAERTAAKEFTIKSSNALDTSTVAWLILEPS